MAAYAKESQENDVFTATLGPKCKKKSIDDSSI